MSKYRIILLSSLILLLFSCCQEKELPNNVTRLLANYPNSDGEKMAYVIIPSIGCDACISYAEHFVKDNYYNPKLLFVFTRIASMKKVKYQYRDIIDHPNILIDSLSIYSFPEEEGNFRYPAIIYLDRNKIKQIDFQSVSSPNSLTRLENNINITKA